MEEKIKKIQATQFRNGIMGSFEALSDTEFQQEHWIDPNYKHAFWDNIYFYGLETLLDSFDLRRAPYEQIGLTLYDEEEAKAIQEYCEWLYELLYYDIGDDLPDEKYYNHPEWKNVVSGALKLRKLMAQKNKENGFWREFREDINEDPDDKDDRMQREDEKFLD